MSPASRYLPRLLAFATFAVAIAIGWAGIHLAKSERIERIERDRSELHRVARELQVRIDHLEARYREHLERLTRSDLNDRFALRDTLDRVVGVRQFSTLRPGGEIDVHLLASDETRDEAEVPLPVIDPRERPVGRGNVVEIPREKLEAIADHGWFQDGQSLFYVHRINQRRFGLLLVEPTLVTSAIREAILGEGELWTGENRDAPADDGLFVNGRAIFASNLDSEFSADVVIPLASRFGDWQIRSRDARETVVSYDQGRLAGSAALALFIALVGGFGSWHLGRALRLAEQRVSFVNRVSHELKTPLTNILLNTDLATDDTGAAGRRRLTMVSEETRRLSRLIDNVLAFSRREQTELELKPAPTRLRPLIEDVVTQFCPSLERRGIQPEIDCGPDLVAIADPDSLTQVLGNLLSNVEKYAASGGRVRIAARAEDSAIALLVADRGPGIPRNERERVFRPFQRLDDRPSEGASGTGLGLAIARDLAERMKGSLQLLDEEDSNDSGATFLLRLPAGDANAVPSAPRIIEFPDSRAS